MQNINSVTLTGNLTRDPELRSTPGGLSICKMGLAVNERRKNSASGEWEEYANFFDITVFGRQADACGEYLQKGRPIAVQGRLRWSSWEGEHGKRSKVEVIADHVQFLGDGKVGESRSSGPRSEERPQGGGSGYRMQSGGGDDFEPSAVASAEDDEDIPF